LLHFDFRQGTLLSKREFGTSFLVDRLRTKGHTSPIASVPQTTAVSLSPPFVLCLSISSTGTVAAGTADGQIWIGLGGDKKVSVKKTRKWGGLREDMGLSKKIADGPVVAL
jgi:hypothetical protein